MSKFITKIQLEDPGEDDYKKLQHELERKLFKNEPFAARSKAYVLGRGVFYSIEGNFILQEVIAAVIENLVREVSQGLRSRIRRLHLLFPVPA